MARVYVAPTEPVLLRDNADVVSLHPEHFGCDVFIHGLEHSIGIQRKTLEDLVASVDDGRLATQLQLMQGTGLSVVLLEGPIHFDHADNLVVSSWGQTWSKNRFRRTMMSVRSAGVHIERSEDLVDTQNWIELLSGWSDVEHHTTFTPKPKTVRGEWGEQKRRHYQVQSLMAFPGIGQGLAERILDTIGYPLELVRDLSLVKGLGRKKIEQIEDLFKEEP